MFVAFVVTRTLVLARFLQNSSQLSLVPTHNAVSGSKRPFRLTGFLRREETWELSHQLFILDRTQVLQCGMPANAVVKALHTLENTLLGLGAALKACSLSPFTFQAREEALHDRVIITVTHATHAHLHSQGSEAGEIVCGRIRAPLLGMHQQFIGGADDAPMPSLRLSGPAPHHGVVPLPNPPSNERRDLRSRRRRASPQPSRRRSYHSPTSDWEVRLETPG